ncbi:cell division protein FtsB [Exilibacterium tricleocarpae]|uniref:Cell division protein FtsB n=1 Tax=Exilibacterium tricleocarpae TaxID=2591008 RepID=A0A545U559_9GAMM|nr:cell division protein FtsB [Exilibacterium tricleocarpae]TQV84607.1 cell division protein FtsB [Exilibacterium tricleocarpae]
MKWIVGILLLLLLGLQYRLWVGDGSFAEVTRLEREIRQQHVENDRLRERNRVLAIEVGELKAGLDSVEARAREDMGMIKNGETFYMVVDDDKQ